MGFYERLLLQDPFPIDLVKIGLANHTSVLCVAKETSKVFVAFKIVQEIQRRFPSKFSLIVSQGNSDCFTQQFIEAVNLQTTLKCRICTNESWKHDSNTADIQIASPSCIAHQIQTGTISWSKINLLLMNDCHLVTHGDHPSKFIIDHGKSHDHYIRPITVGLSSQLPVNSPSQLESTLREMESVFGCNCSVSCDLVAMNRYGEKSQENVISYSLENKTEGMSHLISSQIASILEYLMEKDKVESGLEKSTQAILSHIIMLCNTCNNILRRFGASAAEYNAKIIMRELTKMEKKAIVSEDIEVLRYCKETMSLVQKGCSDKSQDYYEMTPVVIDLISRLLTSNIESKVSGNSDTPSTNDACCIKSPLASYIEKCEQNAKRHPVIVILCISDHEAAALNFLLNKAAKLDQKLSYIKSAYLSSSSIRQSETCQEAEHVESQAIIQLINQGEVNVLVLSCDVENDIYMSSCKQLIRFAIPKDYLSYVKVKRILRCSNSEVIFFEENENLREKRIQQYQVLKEVESVLSTRCEPFKSTVNNDAFWERFACKSEEKLALEEDPRLAIPLINRYCSSFPNDGFGCSQPHHEIKVKEQAETFHVESTLQLPSHSPIYRPFKGLVVVPKEQATPSLLAQARFESCVAAAMLACKTLLETGELDKQGPRLSADDYTFKKANASCSYEVADGCNGVDGSTKRKRAYERKRPSVLMNSLPLAEMPCYIYSISIRTTQEPENDLIEDYVSSNMLGLLSRNRIPKIPKFIIYKKAIELIVSIKECGHLIAMTADEFALIQRFHRYIHSEIMHINSDPEDESFRFEPESQTYGCYVVPLETIKPGDQDTRESVIAESCEDLSLQKLNLQNNNTDGVDVNKCAVSSDDAGCEGKLSASLNPVQSSRTVAFEFLRNIEDKLEDLSNPKDPPPQSHIDFENYRGRIITAVYMKTPTKYLVIDILYDMSPLSPFPDLDVAATFSDYFKQRYGLEVKDEQPLLEVKNLSRVSSCLVSKYRDTKGHERALPSNESKRKKRSHVLLIPELCSIHPVPSSLWQDVLFIPSILHRLKAILVAEEFRQTIATHSGVGSIDWPETVGLPLLTSREGTDEDNKVLSSLKGDLQLPTDVEMLQLQGDQSDNDMHKEPSSVMKLQELTGQSNGSDSSIQLKEASEGGKSSTVLMKKALTKQSNDIGRSSQFEKSSEEQQLISCESYTKIEILNPSEKETEFSSTKITKTAITKEPHHMKAVVKNSEVNSNSVKESFSRMKSEINEPSSTLILKGLTCISAVDLFNHDRLEMFGDAFIKFAVSLNMYCETPLLNVGKLSFYRGLNISNRQLFYLGRALNIPSYIFNAPFQPFVSWRPHGFKQLKKTVSQEGRFKLNPDTNDIDSSDNDDDIFQETSPSLPSQGPQVEIDAQMHIIASDKSVADTTEATIGAYLVTGGPKSALKVMKWLGMDVTDYLNSEDASALVANISLLEPAEDQLSSDVSLLEAEFKNVEASIGHSFRNKHLLYQAFIHVTYPRGLSRLCSSYEQLEFLGDALLDYFVTRHLYFTYKDMSPGLLTDVRSAIVNSYSFAFLSVQLGLHKHLRSFSPAVFRVVNRFTAMLKNTIKKKTVANPDQVFSSVFVPPDDNDENNDGIEVPKVLADIFESVVAAVFVDTGMDVERTWLVVYKLLKAAFDHYEDHPPSSPIRQLKEMFKNDVSFTSCELTITGRYSCHVSVKGFGKFKGTGRNLKIARSTAAQRALAHIEEKRQRQQKQQ